ncbi:adhesin biosynthesis transcription regulatory family protein [Shewanella algae]|uniref:adhesin biosynthesis transcription regulatory family protein n=1 Tax=Shewanella algae TaxID=38313 RepID=UPI001FB9803E|nr:adhesin biosynthesis transcription regulatory family protein [Shewanella algae]
MTKPRQMNYLLPGGESEKRFELLLSRTKIRSEAVIGALREIYVNGLPQERAAARFGLDKSNLSRDMSKLEEVAATVEAIKEIDYCHLSERKILRVPVPQVNSIPVK